MITKELLILENEIYFIPNIKFGGKFSIKIQGTSAKGYKVFQNSEDGTKILSKGGFLYEDEVTLFDSLEEAIGAINKIVKDLS